MWTWSQIIHLLLLYLLNLSYTSLGSSFPFPYLIIALNYSDYYFHLLALDVAVAFLTGALALPPNFF